MCTENVTVSRFDDDSMTPEKTGSLRFVLAILILILHSSNMFGFSWPQATGYMSVGAFLFLSGYGLHESLKKKKGYLKTFIPKRYPAILLPYFICSILTAIIYFVTFSETNLFDKILARIFAFPPNHWYVMELLTFYTIFFLSFLFLRGRWGVISIIIMSTSAALIMGYYFNATVYYISFTGFLWGVLFSFSSEKLFPFLKKYYIPIIIILLILFFIPYYAYGGYGRPVPHVIFTGIRCSIFILLIVLLRMLNFRKNILVFAAILLSSLFVFIMWGEMSTDSFYVEAPRIILIISILVIVTKIGPLNNILHLGKDIAYEFFLIHWTLLRVVYSFNIDSFFIMVLLSIVLSIIVSFAIRLLTKFILKRYNRAFDNLDSAGAG